MTNNRVFILISFINGDEIGSGEGLQENQMIYLRSNYALFLSKGFINNHKNKLKSVFKIERNY